MNISHHARIRLQQRGISLNMVDLLINYGHIDFDKGDSIFWLNKNAIKRLKKSNISTATIDKLRKIYVVFNLQDNTLITAAYRLQRLKKQRKYHTNRGCSQLNNKTYEF